jgi:hypothetical protein
VSETRRVDTSSATRPIAGPPAQGPEATVHRQSTVHPMRADQYLAPLALARVMPTLMLHQTAQRGEYGGAPQPKLAALGALLTVGAFSGCKTPSSEVQSPARA